MIRQLADSIDLSDYPRPDDEPYRSTPSIVSLHIMNILFICGALEPGKDGVGDYTRRLAGALQSLGHRSAIIALYDHYVAEDTMADQPSENSTIPVLRISSNTGDFNRYRRAKEWTDAFAPLWISLQFVPYSFNPKGLPFSLARELRVLVKERQLHIMFHEIWIGSEKSIDLKRWMTAALQQKIISRMISSLCPVMIHTQLPLAQYNLQTIVRGIHPLPLFSNIDIFSQPVQPANQVLRVGFFSQAAASKPIISFMEALCSNARAAGNTIELLFIGGNAARMREAGEIFNRSELFKNTISYTGFLPAEGISVALQRCSLGITEVPRHALGKSGSVAAFLHHGIPVAAPVVHPGRNARDIGFFSEGLCSAILCSPDMQALANAKEAVGKAKYEIDLRLIAKLFMESIYSQTPTHHLNSYQ